MCPPQGRLNFGEIVMKMGMSVRITAACLMLVALLGCTAPEPFQVSARFNQTRDIDVGRTGLFDGVAVGEVLTVTPEGAGSIVAMSVTPEAAEIISADAALVVNRIKPGAPLELHNPSGVMVEPLQAGQRVQAMDSMLELMAWSVGDAINAGGEQLAVMVDEFQRYIKSDEFQQNAQAVQQQLQDALGTTAAALKTIGEDVAQSIVNVAATEQQLAKAIDELGDELGPVVEEMARSSADLASELDEFAAQLENATPEQKASGERLIQSITDLLAKLNQSLEQGSMPKSPATPEASDEQGEF